MRRGSFQNIIANDKDYKDSQKELNVTLEWTHFIWLENLVEKISPINIGNMSSINIEKFIIDYLKYLKEEVNKNTQRPFIYFISYRTRVRFLSVKKSFFFKDQLKITFLVGKRKKVKIKLYNNELLQKFPEINFSDKQITFKNELNDGATFSVHSFLAEFNISLGINSEIGYVGKTINPEERPINRNHRGLADVSYHKLDEGYDIFIFFNQFRMATHSMNSNSFIDLYVGSSFVDDIGAENEGLLIEKLLIAYFQLDEFQSLKSEKSFLDNSLARMAKRLNVKLVKFMMGVNGECEYFTFNSEKISAKRDHIFDCVFTEDGAVINSFDSTEELVGQSSFE